MSTKNNPNKGGRNATMSNPVAEKEAEVIAAAPDAAIIEEDDEEVDEEVEEISDDDTLEMMRKAARTNPGMWKESYEAMLAVRSHQLFEIEVNAALIDAALDEPPLSLSTITIGEGFDDMVNAANVAGAFWKSLVDGVWPKDGVPEGITLNSHVVVADSLAEAVDIAKCLDALDDAVGDIDLPDGKLSYTVKYNGAEDVAAFEFAGYGRAAAAVVATKQAGTRKANRTYTDADNALCLAITDYYKRTGLKGAVPSIQRALSLRRPQANGQKKRVEAGEFVSLQSTADALKWNPTQLPAVPAS